MKLDRDILRKVPLSLRVEIEENARRKPLTQSELAAQQRRILAELRKHKAPGRRTDLTGTTSASPKAEVRATAIVGKIFNEGHAVVEKRLAIIDAAATDREKFGKLVDDMDRTGRVNGVYKRLKVIKQAEQIRVEPSPLPGRGPYRVIVADPPWQTRVREDDPSCRRLPPYPTMSIEEIGALPIIDLAHDDCVLWLWTTNADLLSGDALIVVNAWHFRPVSLLTWVKDRMGIGHSLRNRTEQCIMAVRGNPTITLTNQTTALSAPARGHSVKPVEFYDLVESLCPAPRYADLFSRYRRNERWDCHGDEAPTAPNIAGSAS